MTLPYQLWPIFILLILEIQITSSAPDFSIHLHSILKNHTAHACENDILTIVCPPRTSVVVLSAFYGRRVLGPPLCLSTSPNNMMEEDTHCTSAFAIEKVRSECQDRQSCHISVLSLFFEKDPCPLTTKYLQVSYKCQPQHHRTRLACENEHLRLLCKNSTVLAIYSATFGHLLHGSPNCSKEPGSYTDMECVSATALRKVSRRCHGKESCSLVADVMTFGDPCFPGTRKHLRVSFTCVPQYLLTDVGFGSTNPFMISDYTHDFPEKVVLYFVSGICAGLVFLLCLFGLRSMSTLVKDVKEMVSGLNDELSQRHCQSIREDLFEDELSDTSSFRCLTKSHCSDMHSSSMLTLQMAEQEVQQRELPRDNS
ncbi:protein eva-1 homolog C [Periophthalmus magnuspinnatus]|uniref:protein eva-1 homolog C n=1 Tax=Periophthalmus magnuspinnatus TaxID=409849 RepID=UPI002436BFB1|nr:protein eva-1 homolog C [Periophthalmus magnuspinnatus]